MPGTITTQFKLNNADQFFESVSEASPVNLYVGVGRPWAWPDDGNPPDPVDSIRETVFDVWLELLAMKKVTVSDVSYVTERVDWTFSTLYTAYQDNADMWANNYYVVTDDFNVYKCINNNGGAVSQAKPTATSNTVFTLADGYSWKYMYAITAAKASKFLSPTYMPIQTLTSDDGSLQWDIQQTAANTAVEFVEVTAGGSAFVGHADTAAAANTSTVTLAAGASGLDGAFVNSEIYIVTGTGAGQKRDITGYNGITKVANVSSFFAPAPDANSVYNVGPQLTDRGNGTGWDGYAVIDTGAIGSIEVTAPGSGYSNAIITLVANTGSGATLHPHISPVGGHGRFAVSELSGHNVMLNVRLDASEGDTHPANNDFRKIVLMRDPIVDNTGLVANASVYDLTTRITIGGISGTFLHDEVVTGATSGASGKIVTVNTSVIRMVDVQGTFVSETVDGEDSLASATASATVNTNIQLYSGDLLYLDTRVPIERAPGQTEDIKMVIRF